MEKPQFSAQFAETKKTLEASQAEINEFLEQESLNERDRVRLTRVLQLVERYQPDREVPEPPINKWRSYLESIYRFLPTIKKSKKPIDNISPNSYLLAEKTIASLRELRQIDFKFEQENDFSEEEILNQERPEEVLSQEVLDTSLTLDYERKNWGVERICLDGIQNHLPSDSKGENVWVRCLVEGKWVSLVEARQKPEKIEAVRFVDDGVGFDAKNLSLMYSLKTEEQDSRGQFGEGMKMMAAAALREGLDPEMESQNWRAKPVAKDVNIKNTRKKSEQTVQQLAFKVDHLAGEPMIGSRTTFWQPTKPFIDELMQIESKVLALRPNYHPEFVANAGEIVDREPGKLFVKGIYVTGKKTLLSYNFDDVETNRDRNTIVSEGIEKRIGETIQALSDKRLAKTILQKSILEPTAIECCRCGLEAEHPIVWLDGFYEAFGKDAVLDTGFKIPDVFKDKSINRVKLPSGMVNLLLRAGVKTDREVTPDFWEETIPTSFTLEYGKEIWDEERILLDAVQNHLPQDSGGSMVGLRFRTTDGKWYPFDKLPDTPDSAITDIKIYDDGRGYDSRLLGFISSTKADSDSTGKFGEGLKMLAIAALRSGIEVTLSSQDWTAKPRVLPQEINNHKVNQLVFDVVHTVKGKKDDDNKSDYQSSSTTFSKPTSKLLQEFRHINEKVLAIDEPQPVEKTTGGDVLSLTGGMVYVRELLIPGDHNLLFTYHLPKLEIKNRDRSLIEQAELGSAIAGIWSKTKNPEVIKSFLFKANLATQCTEGQDKLEFSIDFRPEDSANWKKMFEEIFGKDTAIRDVRSQDYDAMQQNLHVGLDLVSFPTAVYQMLQGVGLPTYESRLQEMTDVDHVPDEELTAAEKEIMELLQELDEFLPGNRPSSIKIYNPKTQDQRVALGFSDRTDIHLLREILPNFVMAADVYFHEKTHHNTGAQDASKDFRNYLTFALSQLAIRQLKQKKPELVKEAD